MPRWSIPILWYPDSAITSLYQPVLTPVPLGDSASKAWSLLDNAYPQQDSALANAQASLPLGTDIRASLHLLTRNANPTGLIHSSCTSFLQILNYRFVLLWFVLFLNHFSSLWGMGKMGLLSGQRNDPPDSALPPNRGEILVQRSTNTSKKTIAKKYCKQKTIQIAVKLCVSLNRDRMAVPTILSYFNVHFPLNPDFN